MSKTAAWEIVGTQQNATGDYIRLNLYGKGNVGCITVKDRKNQEGERFVCLSCLSNSCAHTAFVRGRAS